MLHAIDNDDSLNPHPDKAPADPESKEWPPEVWEEDDLAGVDPEMPDNTETDR